MIGPARRFGWNHRLSWGFELIRESFSITAHEVQIVETLLPSHRQSPSGPIFRFDQEDLRARSVEPVLYEREYYPLNHLYGGAEILRQYADLPPGRPAPWAMQTVMTFFSKAEWDRLDGGSMKGMMRQIRETTLPCRFTVNEAYAEKLRELGVSGVSEVGSIFLYACELYRRNGFEDAAVQRRGTIALPDKSDLGKVLDFDREAYAAKLAALPEEYQPVYVSMHWRDYERCCHEPYLRAGLKMVCSGHPNDPLFHQRLYDVCRQFKYSCSNEISTSFVTSILSGCHFFYLDGGEVTIQRTVKGLYVGQEPTLKRPGRKACVDASPFPPNEETRGLQQELAAQFAGVSFFKPPSFFREQWDQARDQLSALLNTEDLSMDNAPAPEVFARWLPFGFDADGRSDHHCGLEVPAREGWAGVEIGLKFPPPAMPDEVRSLMIILDGEETQTYAIQPDQKLIKISIPLRKDGGRRKIDITGPPPRTISVDRSRSLQLMGVKWLRTLQADNQEALGAEPGLIGRLMKFWK